ncbi:MAG TPA: NAD(+)/NADH kinase, partial [Chlamydiales bacterium]|nr:NAD(+)/NADH kinase [Chlamydiales bacterium]
MKIAIYPSNKIEAAYDVVCKIVSFLKKKNIEVYTENGLAQKLGINSISSFSENDLDFIISLGGDGTILRILHKENHLNAPILGINLGYLGFMADIPIEDMEASLQELIDGEYTVENRMIIEGKTENNFLYAANDLVIHRGQNHSLIELSLYIDNLYVNTFLADG